MARHSLKRFAMPFLQASLVKQILIGLILGIALAGCQGQCFFGFTFYFCLKSRCSALGFCVGDVRDR